MGVRLLVAIISTVGCAGLALAERGEHRAAAVDDVLPGRPEVTYQALLSQFMADLAVDGAGVWTTSGMAKLRRIDGEAEDDQPFSFGAVETLEMVSEGKPVLLLATDGDVGEAEFTMILAAYDLSTPEPRLIDYVDAGMDRWTALGTAFELAGDTDAFSISGNHDNSSESFEATDIAFLRNGRITEIAGVFAYGARTCAWMTTQEASYDTQPEPGARYASLVLSVTQETTRQDGDCGDDDKPLAPEGKQIFTDVYRWNEAKGAYASATNNLGKALAPE